MLVLIATLTIKPGSGEAVIAAAKPCIAGTRAEPGCVSYDLNHSVTDPDTMVFVERWASREAIDAHMRMPHFLAWREKAAGLILDRKIEIITPAEIASL
ncbi:MAG: putative quinol monooxygenase [Alsobacter sp.]